MNEQANSTEYEFLWQLLANPADNNHSHIFNLQSLLNDFPQSGALYALLMPNGDRRNLKHAAAYFNPVTLHKLTTSVDSLPVVTDGQIAHSDDPLPVPADVYFKVPAAEPFVPPVVEDTPYFPVIEEITPTDESDAFIPEEARSTDDTFFKWQPTPAAYQSTENDLETAYNTFSERENIADTPIIQQTETVETEAAFAEPASADNTYAPEETAIDKADDVYAYQAPAEVSPAEDYHEAVYTEDAAPLMTELATEESREIIHTPPVAEENLLAQQYDDFLFKSDAKPAEPVYSVDDKVEYFHQDIDDEIYDEIVSIEDIGLEQLAIINKNAPAEQVEAEKSSYFVFEPAIDESNHEKPEVAVRRQAIPQNSSAYSASTNDVSRYNDEKMPYSFMWWLEKTRKEHANTYQPYINNPNAPAKPQKQEVPDELQQQYYQNIVGVSSLNELDQAAPKITRTHPVKKEDKIIDRFIQQEPKITPPGGIKLDNENKAKNSSEDRDELVTETLARIYIEQMLYSKAILTYKKLMLKFPEKSLYFAGQIEELENKIN